VVATFCHSIARGLPVEISDPGGIINFYYIDDVIDSFLKQLEGDPGADCDGFYRLPPDQKYAVTLQGLADRLYCFEAELQQGREPRPGDRFSEKLYRTYLSYRPTELN
jgi:UDP-2-acetamido-2,6-beta-L-arabino-hexul-4-ose reductase